MFVEFPQYYRFLRVKVHHENYDWHYSIALVSAGLHSLRYCFTYTIDSFDMCFIILYVAEGKTLIYWNSNFNRWGSSLLYQWLEMSGGVETSFEKGNSSLSHTMEVLRTTTTMKVQGVTNILWAASGYTRNA